MRTSSAHSFNDGVKGHIDFQHVINFYASGLHGISLRNGAGKAIEKKTLRAVGLGNAFLHQIDDQVVTDQTAGVHDFFSLNAQWCSCFHCRTKHIAGGNLGNAIFLANEGRLCAFTRTRRAQQNKSHGGPLIIMNSAYQAGEAAGRLAQLPLDGSGSASVCCKSSTFSARISCTSLITTYTGSGECGSSASSLRTRSRSSGVSTPGPGACSVT